MSPCYRRCPDVATHDWRLYRVACEILGLQVAEELPSDDELLDLVIEAYAKEREGL